jgi:hypothetical protein
MSDYYRLEGRTIVPCDAREWSSQYENMGVRRVGDTIVKSVRISTVFLGLDHAVGGGRPLIFETMVFGGHLDGEQVRSSTYDEAEAGACGDGRAGARGRVERPRARHPQGARTQMNSMIYASARQMVRRFAPLDRGRDDD